MGLSALGPSQKKPKVRCDRVLDSMLDRWPLSHRRSGNGGRWSNPQPDPQQ